MVSDIDIPLTAEECKDTYCLHSDELWDSVLSITAHCKKTCLFWRLRVALICMHGTIQKEVWLSSFLRLNRTLLFECIWHLFPIIIDGHLSYKGIIPIEKIKSMSPVNSWIFNHPALIVKSLSFFCWRIFLIKQFKLYRIKFWLWINVLNERRVTSTASFCLVKSTTHPKESQSQNFLNIQQD